MSARHAADLPDAHGIGREAARRALARVGARKVESRRMTMLVENRAAKLDRYLRMLRLPDAEIITVHLMNKDSLEMTDADRAEVRDQIAGILAEGAPIVISHGTDTMVETGRFLEGSFPDLKAPIILTGAMTPLGFEGSAGLQNLTESLVPPGVYIVLHGQVFPVSRVRKDKDKATFVWA